MKNYSLLSKLVVCGALVCCTLGLSQSPSYGQGRTLTAKQIDAIVKPTIDRCSASGSKARLDPYSIIPTANAREFPKERIASTMHGMWRGQVIGSPLDSKDEKGKESNVDYVWIIDSTRNEGLIIAIRNGNNSLGGIGPVANAPKMSYLICATEGYLPNVDKNSEIHEFVKVSDSIEDAPRVLATATGVLALRKSLQNAQGDRVGNPVANPNLRRQDKGGPTLSDLWKVIVASGYFKSLPAVAFAGGLFKPMRIELVPSPIGPAQISMSWDSEYYGGGTTGIKFTPGVPMKGVEYTQFVGTTASDGDYLVASPGNGKLAKVEAMDGGDYDLAFNAASLGPLQGGGSSASSPAKKPQSSQSHHRTGNRKYNHRRSSGR